MHSDRPLEKQALPRRMAAAEQIAIAASGLARSARENELVSLADLLEQAVLEAWREASGEQK
jgi:hypothetical protein